eukprot:gene19572-26255_t
MDVFIFRRDLRIDDNIGLHKCLQTSENITFVFVFTEDQIVHNPYFSNRAFDFMLQCVPDLSVELQNRGHKLLLFNGNEIEALSRMGEVRSVHFNAEVTPYARERDRAVQDWGASKKVRVERYSPAEYTVVDPTTMQKPYQVFTPFYKKY